LDDEFLAGIEQGIDAIQDRPQTWPIFAGAARRYLVHRFPYGIVYVCEQGWILVLAIMHLHRKPGYWADRRTT
jgi:hypothetical protein